MKARLLLATLLLISRVLVQAQITVEVLGAHDLTPRGTSPVKGSLSASCLYCHAPHSGAGGLTPLWNQTLSTQTYTPYGSTTYNQKGNTMPPLGADSSLCLSCHDGTVAPGLTIAYGKMGMSGAMIAADVFGTNLQGSHPFSLILPIKDAPDLVASLAGSGKTADTTNSVKLINGNIECTSCHNPHVQAVDRVSLNFLVLDNSRGQICLSCHDPNRVTTGQANVLAGWPSSIHASAANAVAGQPATGTYRTVMENACISCHLPHNANEAVPLLRGANEQACVGCHNGGSNVSPAIPNVFAEFAKIGHPFPSGKNLHDPSESGVLNQNRHATCADCHNAHASRQVATFTVPPLVRPSQSAVDGVNALDGVTVLSPAINQYENCLRCHGSSIGKAANLVFGYLPVRAVSGGDPLNIIPEFLPSATSSHPVMHDRTSALPQFSLLAYMLNLDGITQGRAMGTRILCTDCHNSDDNREFGGVGPNGPHGSKWTHILERRYEMSQAATPGGALTNAYPNPDLSVNGPYALCGKCHNLSLVLSGSGFPHQLHVSQVGASCSVCHTAHGLGAQSAGISGERLVNFDASVVAPHGASPISYNQASRSCTLVCHGKTH
jgi:predicted CXXCH cytochrome family protein